LKVEVGRGHTLAGHCAFLRITLHICHM